MIPNSFCFSFAFKNLSSSAFMFDTSITLHPTQNTITITLSSFQPSFISSQYCFSNYLK